MLVSEVSLMGTIIVDKIDRKNAVVRLEINGIYYEFSTNIIDDSIKEGDELVLIKNNKSSRKEEINKLASKLFKHD